MITTIKEFDLMFFKEIITESLSIQEIDKIRWNWINSQDTAKYFNNYKTIPKLLYHGTTFNNLNTILKYGLTKGMLTPNVDTASCYGKYIIKISEININNVVYLGHDSSIISNKMYPVYLVIDKIDKKHIKMI